MKKILSIVLACVLCISMCAVFTGCDEKEEKKEDGFKIGAIYINSQKDIAGYTYAHHKGITEAMKQLKLSTDDLYIIDNTAEDYDTVMKAIDTLAGKGCDMIIGISFGYLNAFNDAAAKEEYADIIFSHATGYLSNDKNFNNYFGRIYQARYLSGIAAGMKSLELQNNNIGYVAAWGTEYAETCSGINAFTMGAQAVNPDAKVYVNQISTWGNEALERSAAQALIDTYKCCVIAQHCDSAQPQFAAEDNGVFGCGYNSDMTVQAPKAHLTAPIWNWDVYYKLAIETAMNTPKEFVAKVGNYYGGLAEGFVDISPLSKNCTEGTKEVIEAVRALMVSGEWDVFSNVKLSIDAEGNITQKTEALLDNKGGTVISEDGTTFYCYNDKGELVDSNDFGKFQRDGVITGSMNYYVAGVEAGQ